MTASTGNTRSVLIIVENLPCPFDRRVWQEATTLCEHGYTVSIICPNGKGYTRSYEFLEGIHIHRYYLPVEGAGALSYFIEYSGALLLQFLLALRVFFTRGFDVIHACNPPDTIFIIGLFFKLFGKKFLFDHHDINPELYEAKFDRRDVFYRLLVFLERMSYQTATIALVTNESYREIALTRGRMPPEKVFVVRSGPKLDRLQIQDAVPSLKCGRRYLVGYLGVMGQQEGIDHLLRVVDHLVHTLKRTDIHFGLVGGGTELPKMQELCKTLGLEDYVTFTGRVPDAEMLAMLNTADICVNPDVPNVMNDKSTMNKVMEYMALGKAIVQYDLKEGKFSAGVASLYAAHNDIADFAGKIVELLDDPVRREKMGNYGRERVLNELQWKYEAPKLLWAYDVLYDESAAPVAQPSPSSSSRPS